MDRFALVDARELEELGRTGRALQASGRLSGQLGEAYPSAVACLLDDFQSLAVHLRFPAEHWRRIRHTNLIERTFGESRRRTKLIGRLPGERTCVALVWAVLDRQSRGWRGGTVTPRALRRMQDLRRQLFADEVNEVSELDVSSAAGSKWNLRPEPFTPDLGRHPSHPCLLLFALPSHAKKDDRAFCAWERCPQVLTLHRTCSGPR